MFSICHLLDEIPLKLNIFSSFLLDEVYLHTTNHIVNEANLNMLCSKSIDTNWNNLVTLNSLMVASFLSIMFFYNHFFLTVSILVSNWQLQWKIFGIFFVYLPYLPYFIYLLFFISDILLSLQIMEKILCFKRIGVLFCQY